MTHLIRISRSLAFIHILFFVVILGALPFSGLAQSRKDSTGIDQLRNKAWKVGKVQVIVHIAVPLIDELSAASAKYWGADLGPEIAQSRTISDMNLTRAIEFASWKLLAELQGTEYEEVARFQFLPFIVLRVPPETLAVLEASSDVLGIEEDYPEKLVNPVAETGEGIKVGDPGAGDDIVRPSLSDTAELIGAKTVWDWGFTGAGWYVAIVDTGIRRTHEFFSGKRIIEACRAKGRDGVGPSGDCPNGLTSQNGTGSAVHYADTYTGYDHGTHVAGIAAGNRGSLSGIAKGANIIAIKVFSKFNTSDCGGSPCISAWDSDVIAGLEYVYSLRGSYKIASANLSLGGMAYSSACNSSSYKAAIDLLRSVGIATAIATGNDYYCGYILSPACVPTSVAVGSSTKTDEDSPFSNWHKTMQKLFAPGSSIYSSIGASNSSYGSKDGTSMATPHVTGAWALLKQAVPGASVSRILDALQDTGLGITSVCDGRRTPIPRIRIDKALAKIAPLRLTLKTNAFGTTDPAPGIHNYPTGTRVQISPLPKTYCTFVKWSGSAEGSADPLVLTMDNNKTVTADFRYIFAPAATVRQVLNRSYSQAEYINVVSWQAAASNAGLDIDKYRIYLVTNGTKALLAEVTADKSEYWHRRAGQASLQYAIAAVTRTGRESAPAPIGVGMQPVINSFFISPSTIKEGESATLFWDVSNATSISINQDIGTVSANGSRKVTPSQDTTYTITASNSDGTVSQSCRITVVRSSTCSYLSIAYYEGFTTYYHVETSINQSPYILKNVEITVNIYNGENDLIDYGVGTIASIPRGSSGKIDVILKYGKVAHHSKISITNCSY